MRDTVKMSKVVHCKKEAFDILIDRTTKWGNPFVIGKDGTREQVIEKYVHYFFTQDHLVNSIHELVGKTLGCWCSPQACHGDFLESLCWYYETRYMYPEGERNLGRFQSEFPYACKYDLEKIYRVV